MYSKKQILAAARFARENEFSLTSINGDVVGNNTDVAGMLEDYNRLKNSFIPQVMQHIESKGDHLKFPHMIKPKENENNSNV